MSSGLRLSRGAVRRLAVGLVLLGAFVGAAEINIAGSPSSTPGAFAPAFSISPTSSDSSTWYCSIPAMAKFASQNIVLHLTNTSDRILKAKVALSIGGTVSSTALTVAAKADRSVPLSASAKNATGVTVDFAGGASLAGLAISGPNGYSQEFCQPSPGPSWIVEGLSTAGKSLGVVSVYNPFGTDSIVDMSLLTSSGSQSPGPLQAMVLTPGASLNVNLLDWEQGQRPMAVKITTRLGRVVVGGLELRSDSSASGISFAPAMAETFDNYNFPLLDQTSNQSVTLDLYNFSSLAQKVKVAIQSLGQMGSAAATLTSGATTTPSGTKSSFSEVVPAETAVSIPLKTLASVPVGTLFSLSAQGSGTVSALITQAGSSLGPSDGLFLDPGANQSWPSWFSMLYEAPISIHYDRVAVAYSTASASATALLTRYLHHQTAGVASNSAAPSADSGTGLVLASRQNQASILRTSNPGGFPASFLLNSSGSTVFAMAFISADGSLIPFASIPTD